MRSSGRALAVVLGLAAGAFPVGVPAQDVATQYENELAREAALRRELTLAPQLRTQPPGAATAELIGRVRAAVARYGNVARRFPRSGYSDNALWQGAVLAADAFWQFGDTRDKATALRLFDWLTAEYPKSSLVPRVAGHTGRLTATQASSSLSTLKAIRRDVLPGAIRVTLELEREASFHEERLEGPPRVFVDLRNTLAVDALQDATITFADEIVQQARVGSHPDNRTRVVLDLRADGRYSVYSLYNPYRIVIDFERTGAANHTTVADTKRTDGASRPADLLAPAVKGTGDPSPEREAVVVAPRVSPVARVGAAPVASASSAVKANADGSFSLSRQLGLGVARVVVDPGHGGQDPGAQIKGLSEAEIVLDVALRLERLLAKEPEVEVVLTRRTNKHVSLGERTAVANRSDADLFLSIHANASPEASVRGVETYFLNFALNPAAEAIAARENARSSKTMRNLPDIVKAIALNNKINESRDFAALVQASLYERMRKVDRGARNLGVKQAPFMVLIGATMPSVLSEISFLTNRREANLLRTPSYRQQIAEALFQGVMRYQRSLKATKVAVQ